MHFTESGKWTGNKTENVTESVLFLNQTSAFTNTSAFNHSSLANFSTADLVIVGIPDSVGQVSIN